jgi:hypothetical protein
MNKPRKYDSPILEKVAKRISSELSEQNDRRMGLAVKIAGSLHKQKKNARTSNQNYVIYLHDFL